MNSIYSKNVCCRVASAAIRLAAAGAACGAAAGVVPIQITQEALDVATKEAGNSLPRASAEGVKIVSIRSAPGRVITELLELSSWPTERADQARLIEQFKANFRDKLCSDPSVATELKDGVSWQLVYRLPSFDEAFRLAYNANDCGFDSSMFARRGDMSSFPSVAYAGSIKLPDFAGRDKRFASYRTRIRHGMRSGPNYAGAMTVVQIGCGSGCQLVFVGNVATGEVYNFPLGGEANNSMSLSFIANSRLIIARWEVASTDQCIEAKYKWTGTSFALVDRKSLGLRELCD